MPMSSTVPDRPLSRRTTPVVVSASSARVQRGLSIVLAAAMVWAVPAQAQRVRDDDIDLLGLSATPAGASLPAGWQTRAVRGQQLPMSRIIDSSGSLFMRLSGAGHAGWFVHELPEPLLASIGHLDWTWRATLAPVGADVATPATDDATLRVFVVFGRHGRFTVKPRVLFYTLADGDPAPDRIDSPTGVRIAGRPGRARDWVSARADPFGDYRRLWRDAPPPIVAVGVMQDTDQTRSPAIGDIQSLFWRRANAAHP